MDQVKVQLFLLIVLTLGITAPTAEGCSCIQTHFQNQFCYSEIDTNCWYPSKQKVSSIEELFSHREEVWDSVFYYRQHSHAHKQKTTGSIGISTWVDGLAVNCHPPAKFNARDKDEPAWFNDSVQSILNTHYFCPGQYSVPAEDILDYLTTDAVSHSAKDLKVFRAKITGEKIISPSLSLYGEKMIEYKIKLVKMFKGFDKVDTIQYVYTSIHDSLCGVRLDAKNKGQYLLSGYLWHEGKVIVELCGIVERWDNLLLAQKKNLKYRYQKGCECKISTCSKPRCRATSADECIWFPYSSQALQGVCIKRTNGTCNWYMDKSDSHTQQNVGQIGAEEISGVPEVREPKPTEIVQ